MRNLVNPSTWSSPPRMSSVHRRARPSTSSADRSLLFARREQYSWTGAARGDIAGDRGQGTEPRLAASRRRAVFLPSPLGERGGGEGALRHSIASSPSPGSKTRHTLPQGRG